MKDRYKVYMQKPNRVLEKDRYCIDYVNGVKLNRATFWKNISTVSFTLYVSFFTLCGI